MLVKPKITAAASDVKPGNIRAFGFQGFCKVSFPEESLTSEKEDLFQFELNPLDSHTPKSIEVFYEKA